MPASLPRQMFLYLLVGGLQLLLDWMVFVALTSAGLPLTPSNLVGRISGASLGFWLNGRYTFASTARPRLEGLHLRRFIVAWLLLTALSTALLAGVEHYFQLRAAWMAKPVVEALMAVLGFLAWRHWVLR